ncbi:MAG: hypothetical protein QOF45_2590 [Gaiellaceae bacterium]|jgi:hypothetical protein|nr:hypothetical protein [Gaiellaceae bacterium]
MPSIGNIWPEDWADDKYVVWLQVLGDPDATDDDFLDAAERFRNSAQSDWKRTGYPRWYDDDAALDTLTHLASTDRKPDLATSSAAETLAAVWIQKGAVDRDRFKKLANPAKDTVLGYFQLNRPNLLQDLT